MNKIAYVAILAFLLVGCELIEVGSKQNKNRIDVNQSSALGAIYLFKAELDNNNSMGAAQMLRRDGGDKYLATDRIEIIDELNRIERVIRKKSTTLIVKDSISPEKWKYTIEFDYSNKIAFTARKIKGQWFIISIGDISAENMR